MLSQLKLNILANYAGSAVTAVTGVLFVPFYIKFMGIESYGLVGFYASLQALFLLLDMGLRTTLNRELAKMSAVEGMVRLGQTDSAAAYQHTRCHRPSRWSPRVLCSWFVFGRAVHREMGVRQLLYEHVIVSYYLAGFRGPLSLRG